jgi:hypothetical protein
MRQFVPIALLVVMFTSCKKNKEEDQPIANNQAVAWAKTLGGTNYDFGKSVVQLPNGNYVMAGTSRSSDGDIPGSRFGYDPWLVEVDTAGNKIWSVAYGTGADEHTDNLVATSDGGFLIVGHVGFNFDTTANQGFIIKTGSSGNELWRKDYTSSNDSKITDVIANNDGSFIAVGYTTTANGRDGWAFKIDASGNTAWTKTYGGTKEDQFSSIVSSGDGGYVVAGYSVSSDLDVAANKGSFDGLIMKIAGDGAVQWTRTFGGSGKDYFNALVRTNDGGYLAVGSTTSGNGDIPKNRGSLDEWMVKTDASGNKQWVKTYGGTNDEYVKAVTATPDGGFITVGYTNSTNYDVTRFSGDFGGWLIKTDASGNKTAASTYGDNYDDLLDDVITTKDGGYIIAGQTYSPAKQYDGWLVKIKGL